MDDFVPNDSSYNPGNNARVYVICIIILYIFILRQAYMSGAINARINIKIVVISEASGCVYPIEISIVPRNRKRGFLA